ncbi:MAG: autotransporter domain-containing protein [Oceanospirillaceae bacterium]|nr:autotransporter domain-containing protein [Oceanospirillaceae bacterium]
MNRSFRLVWSLAQGMYVVASEAAKSKGKTKSQSAISTKPLSRLAGLLLVSSTGLTALPAAAGPKNIIWNGVILGDWTTDGNWIGQNGAPNEVPTTLNSADGVLINGANINIELSSSAPDINSANFSQNTGDKTSLTINGNGSLTVKNGLILAQNSSGEASVVIDGKKASLTTKTMTLGYSGKGSLTVSNGAKFIFSDTVTTAKNDGSTATINIGAAKGEAATAPGVLEFTTGGEIRYGPGTTNIVLNHNSDYYEFNLPRKLSRVSGTNGTLNAYLVSGTTLFNATDHSFPTDYYGNIFLEGGTLYIKEGDPDYTNRLSINGKFTQTGGTIQIFASSTTNYSRLWISNGATFAADSKIYVNVAENNSLVKGNILENVITVNGGIDYSTFEVTDNSALLDFKAVVSERFITLSTRVESVEDVVSGSDSGSGSGSGSGSDKIGARNQFNPGIGAARVLDDILNSTNTGDVTNVTAALKTLSTRQQVSDAVSETLPLMVAGTSQISAGTLHSTSKVIQARQASFSGLSAGDEFITNQHAWLKPVGNWSRQSSLKGVSGYTADSYGVIGGYDGDINDNSNLGFAASYITTNLKGKDNTSGNSASIESYQGIAYGSHKFDPLPEIEFNWQADVGINLNKGTRVISFMNRVAKADYDSYTLHLGGGVAKNFALNDTSTLIPSVRVDYNGIQDQSYTESGADALNLKVDSHYYQQLVVTAEGTMSHKLDDKFTLVGTAGIGYDLLNEQASLTSSYSGGGTSFVTKGLEPSPWIASVGVNMDYALNDESQLSLHYDAAKRAEFLSQTVTAKYRWLF